MSSPQHCIVCACVFVCVCMSIRVRVCTYTCICVSVHVCSVCVHVCVHVHTVWSGGCGWVLCVYTPPEPTREVVDPFKIDDEKSVGSVTGLHPRLAPQTVRRH